MSLINNQIGTSETTLVNPTAGLTYAVFGIIFCNTDLVNSHTINVYAYPSGGSLGIETMIINSFTIFPGDTFVWNSSEKFVLSALDKITATADTGAKITATVTYMSI